MIFIVSCEYVEGDPSTYAGIRVELSGSDQRPTFHTIDPVFDYVCAHAFIFMTGGKDSIVATSPTIDWFHLDGGVSIDSHALLNDDHRKKALNVVKEYLLKVAREESTEAVMPLGSRVVALSHTDKTRVYIYGHGTYKGQEIPPPGTYVMGTDFNEISMPSPKIELDNGKVVWGAKCHIGPEDGFNDYVVKGRKVITIDPDAKKPEILYN